MTDEFGTQEAGMDWLDSLLARVQRALLWTAAALLLGWCWSQL